MEEEEEEEEGMEEEEEGGGGKVGERAGTHLHTRTCLRTRTRTRTTACTRTRSCDHTHMLTYPYAHIRKHMRVLTHTSTQAHPPPRTPGRFIHTPILPFTQPQPVPAEKFPRRCAHASRGGWRGRAARLGSRAESSGRGATLTSMLSQTLRYPFLAPP